jgi:glycosyltransferase involved in cell wall biosynthesis
LKGCGQVRILVITNAGLFPNAWEPEAGIFFANLLARLVPLAERIVTVSPMGFLPPPLEILPRFAGRRRIPRREFWHGIEVQRPPFLSFGSARHQWLQARGFCRAVAPLGERLHRRCRFDVVVGYGFGPAAHAAQFVARAIRRRCVSWAIGTDVHSAPGQSPENASLVRHNVRHTDLILTESDALRCDILSLCPWARHVHTYYKGIDLAFLEGPADRQAVRRGLGLAADRVCMLMAGRVWRPKGTHEFYETFRRLAAAHPRLDAVWVGDGADRRDLEARAAADRLAGRFRITGRVPRPSALEYMQAADLLVFPSHAEGLPNVVMEGMAAGLPVVATDVGGIREIVLPRLTGLLVPPKNVEALATAAEWVMSHPDLAVEMAARGRRLIWDYFNVARNAAVAMQILDHVARGGAADAPLPACAGASAGTLPGALFLAANGQP